MFGKSKEEKQQEQLQKFMDKYHINELNASDLEIVQNIASNLAGNGALKMGMAFSFADASEQAKVSYLSALVEQNWLIINQNSRIEKLLEKISEK